MNRTLLALATQSDIGARVLAHLRQEPNVQVVLDDRSSGDALARVLDRADAVVLCGSGAARSIHATAARLYAAANRCHRPPRIVHLSSMTVYGARSGHVDEDTPSQADLGAYAESHIAAERLAAQYPRAVVLRPGVEFGPGCEAWTLRLGRLLLARRLGDLGASGDGYCNLVYIEDLLNAVTTSLRLPDIEGHRFNLAVPAPPTWNAYLTAFGCALGAVPIRRVSRRRLKLERAVAPALKALEILTERLHARWLPLPAPLSPSMLALFQQRILLDSSRARRTLGMPATDIAAALQAAAVWCGAALGRRVAERPAAVVSALLEPAVGYPP